MICVIVGIPSYIEPGWAWKTESWVFCTEPAEIDDLKALKALLPRKQWKGRHCPPHWRLTDEEAGRLPFRHVDANEMTTYHRTWRRYINHTLSLPKPRSHRKQSGTGSGGKKPAR